MRVKNIPGEESIKCVKYDYDLFWPQYLISCGKASWERLVGKTRGKTIDAMIHGADCETLLLPLWRTTQVHARIRDED